MYSAFALLQSEHFVFCFVLELVPLYNTCQNSWKNVINNCQLKFLSHKDNSLLAPYFLLIFWVLGTSGWSTGRQAMWLYRRENSKVGPSHFAAIINFLHPLAKAPLRLTVVSHRVWSAGILPLSRFLQEPNLANV